MSLPEHDWRVLRSLHLIALDRYCARVLDECAAVLRDDQTSNHERYLRTFRLLKDRDERIAAAFDDLRRSNAVNRLAAMSNLGVVTDEELARFSPATRYAAKMLADFMASRGKRRSGR